MEIGMRVILEPAGASAALSTPSGGQGSPAADFSGLLALLLTGIGAEAPLPEGHQERATLGLPVAPRLGQGGAPPADSPVDASLLAGPGPHESLLDHQASGLAWDQAGTPLISPVTLALDSETPGPEKEPASPPTWPRLPIPDLAGSEAPVEGRAAAPAAGHVEGSPHAVDGPPRVDDLPATWRARSIDDAEPAPSSADPDGATARSPESDEEWFAARMDAAAHPASTWGFGATASIPRETTPGASARTPVAPRAADAAPVSDSPALAAPEPARLVAPGRTPIVPPGKPPAPAGTDDAGEPPAPEIAWNRGTGVPAEVRPATAPGPLAASPERPAADLPHDVGLDVAASVTAAPTASPSPIRARGPWEAPRPATAPTTAGLLDGSAPDAEPRAAVESAARGAGPLPIGPRPAAADLPWLAGAFAWTPYGVWGEAGQPPAPGHRAPRGPATPDLAGRLGTVETAPAPGLSGPETARAETAGTHHGAARGQEPPIADQVVRAARVIVSQGLATMEVQLDPPSLGAIRLTAALGADGLGVTITAERRETRALLLQSLPDIQSILASRGLPTASVAVSPPPESTGERRAPARRDHDRPERHASPPSRRATPEPLRVGRVDLTA
jgi:flagellar hook-length control protein FliK